MVKESLETKARKAVLVIKEKVTDMDNVLRDLSAKLCYLIKHKGLGGNYYTLPDIDYEKEYEG